MSQILSLFLTVTVSALAATAAVVVHDIDVGRGDTLTFSPSTLFASVGDTVNFHFRSNNHSVAESTFDRPCRPKSGGVDAKPVFSGFVFVPVPAAAAAAAAAAVVHTGDDDDGSGLPMWSMQINSTDPIWLYCSQEEHQHCRNGQSMVINPLNGTDMTIEAYMQAAATANVSSPTVVFGGRLVKDDGGQAADQGSMGTSPTTGSSSSTAATASCSSNTNLKPTVTTNGVAPIVANVVWELGLWGLLGVVFIVTL